MNSLVDHGLPLVQPREQRRYSIVSMQRTPGPISGWQLMRIAARQQVITACEEVLIDLDTETEATAGAAVA